MKSRTLSLKGLMSHPTSYFIAAWSLCAFLISLDFVPRITQYKDTAIIVFFFLVLFNFAGAASAWFVNYKPTSEVPSNSVSYRFVSRTNLMSFWIMGTIFEIIASGGVPLLWILTGNGKTYEDFGVPSIHGVMNAIYLCLKLSAFMTAIKERSARRSVEFAFFLLWSVIVVSRALMTIVLLQSATFFLINSKMSWKVKASLLTAVAASFLVIFGILGDARADQFSILESTGLKYLDPRLSGAVWVYTYLASPIANLALNISVHSAQLKFIPTTFLLPLLPSAVQRSLGFETGFYGFSGYLAHDAFNVGTAFIQIFIDWGIFGVLLYDFILGFAGHMVWVGYRRTGRTDMLSLFIPCIILTVFSNQFNQLPVILLFVLFAMLTRVEHSVQSSEA